MSNDPSPVSIAPSGRTPSSSSWLHARALWSAVSIAVMWLAVLFVGIFGGDFVSSGAANFTKIPVVIFMLPFVLPATIAVARRGFTDAGVQARANRQDEAPAVEEPAQHSTERTRSAA